MAIAFVEGQIKDSGSSPATTSAFTANIGVGQLLVAYGCNDSGLSGQMTGVTDSKGNTWTQVPGMDTTNAVGVSLDAWYCIPTTGGTGFTVSVAFNAANGNMNAIVQYFDGFTGTPTLDKVKTTADTGTPTTCTSGATATTTVADELVVGGAVHASSLSVFTAGSGYTNLTESPVAFREGAMESKVVSSTGAQTATFTIAAGRACIGGVATFYDDVAADPGTGTITFDTTSQTKSITSVTTANLDITAAAVGSWVYMCLHVTGATQTSVTMANWTLVVEGDDPNVGEHIAVFRRKKVSGDTTFAYSYPTSSKSLAVWVSYTGLDGTTPNVAATFAANVLVKNASATTTTTATVTNPSGKNWALAFFAQRSSTIGNAAITWTSDGALTERADQNISAAAAANWSGIEAADSNGTVTAASHSYTATANFAEVHDFGVLIYLQPAAPSFAVLTRQQAINRSYLW